MLSFLFLIISFVTARTIENSWKKLEKQIGEKHLMNTFIIANVQRWNFGQIGCSAKQSFNLLFRMCLSPLIRILKKKLFAPKIDGTFNVANRIRKALKMVAR